MEYVETLRFLIKEHMDAMVDLYGEYIKPKGHHMCHIPDGMEWLGKLLSCFSTERKHKMIKRAALYIFRHMEHTVLTDIVNNTLRR